MGVAAAVAAVATATGILLFGVEDVFDEVAREADCEDDVTKLCPVADGIAFEEPVAAVTPFVVVLLLAAHCPTYEQYYPVAQQIDPHDVYPILLSQINDVAAAAAVMEVCAEDELAGAETRTRESD